MFIYLFTYLISTAGESVKNGYLTPFMESMGKNFTNGVNFAIAGSKTLPASDSFNLKIQIAQFHRFRSLSLELFDKGIYEMITILKVNHSY